jgi:hypothetical protein
LHQAKGYWSLAGAASPFKFALLTRVSHRSFLSLRRGPLFQNSQSALMTGLLKHVGLSGCRSCSPHPLLRSVRIMFIQSATQSNFSGACRTRLEFIPYVWCASPYFYREIARPFWVVCRSPKQSIDMLHAPFNEPLYGLIICYNVLNMLHREEIQEPWHGFSAFTLIKRKM